MIPLEALQVRALASAGNVPTAGICQGLSVCALRAFTGHGGNALELNMKVDMKFCLVSL